jgi:murein tripeptide amidase MpaA
LISDSDEAKEIRSKFVIKIIPMLNPDGVVLGTTKASLLGANLNRRWSKPSKYLHPEIYYTKSMLKYLNRKV